MGKKKRIPREFLGAFKEGHRPTAREFIDDELSYRLLAKVLLGDLKAREELEYITRFNNEFYKAVFTKTEVDLMPSHNERKERYSAQNARQRDVLVNMPVIEMTSIEWVSQAKDYLERGDSKNEDLAHFLEAQYDIPAVGMSEDALVDLLDLKREMEKSNKQ